MLFASAHGSWLSCRSESYFLVVSGKVELTRCGGELTRWRLSRPWANLLLIFSLQSSVFGGPTLELNLVGGKNKERYPKLYPECSVSKEGHLFYKSVLIQTAQSRYLIATQFTL